MPTWAQETTQEFFGVLETRSTLGGARNFRQMRYMTSKSTGKKFKSKEYIEWTKTLKDEPKLPRTKQEPKGQGKLFG